jgi:hypothetical protein
MDLHAVQSRLAAAQLYGGAVDGRYGPKTAAAIEALFLARPYFSSGADAWHGWSAERRVVAAAQLFCLEDGIEVGAIDGLIGPQTWHAFEVSAARARGVEGLETWRDHEEEPATAPAQPASFPSQTQRAMEKFFGAVGANQATLVLPKEYPMCLAWEPSRRVVRFSCHEKIHDATRRVLVRALDAYGPARIRALGLDRFGGCLNVRRMRGGSNWSTHAWGAALDFDPANNQLRWTRARARFARPEYDRWWSLWEAEGFVSLGRARDFDWMHVQAAAV